MISHLSMIASLLTRPVPRDTAALLIQVTLRGVESRTVEARMSSVDSSLYLPASDVMDLLGVNIPVTTRWVTLHELTLRYPTVVWFWSFRDLALTVEDASEALPATQKAFSRQRTQGLSRTVLAPSGYGLALSVNSTGAAQLDAGYSYRGRVYGQVQHVEDRRTGVASDAASLSIIPVRSVYLSVSDQTGSDAPALAARVNTEHVYASAALSAGKFLGSAMLSVAQRLYLYASSDRSTVVTARLGSSLGIQVGQRDRVTSLRLSLGAALLPSPFAVPQ